MSGPTMCVKCEELGVPTEGMTKMCPECGKIYCFGHFGSHHKDGRDAEVRIITKNDNEAREIFQMLGQAGIPSRVLTTCSEDSEAPYIEYGVWTYKGLSGVKRLIKLWEEGKLPYPRGPEGPKAIIEHPDDIGVLLWGDYFPSAVDRMMLYEASITVYPEGKPRYLRWVFKADSDLTAARKVQTFLKTRRAWVDRKQPGYTREEISLTSEGQCERLVRIIRDLFVGPHEDLLDKYGEYIFERH